MVEAVLFDKDGVLVDSQPIYYEINRRAFEEKGYELTREDFVQHWVIIQNGATAVIEENGLGVSVEEIRKRKYEIYLEIDHLTKLMPHAIETLDRLRQHYPVGLVSADDPDFVEKNVARFDLKCRLDVIVSGYKSRSGEHVGDAYEDAISQLEVNPRYVVAVEDQPGGIASAKLAGCKVIAHPTEFTKGLDFSQADAIVSSLSEITHEMLEGLI